MVTTRRGKTTVVDSPASPKVRACRSTFPFEPAKFCRASGLLLRVLKHVAPDSLI